MCWCAVKKLLTHSLTALNHLVLGEGLLALISEHHCTTCRWTRSMCCLAAASIGRADVVLLANRRIIQARAHTLQCGSVPGIYYSVDKRMWSQLRWNIENSPQNIRRYTDISYGVVFYLKFFVVMNQRWKSSDTKERGSSVVPWIHVIRPTLQFYFFLLIIIWFYTH